MTVDHVKVIGDLEEAMYDIEKLKEAESPFARREEILGLKFKQGQKVVDKKTKQKGVVVYGTRVQVAFQTTGGGRS